MKEEWPRATVLLSGSTLTRLFRDDVRYPVGRVERLILRPLSFQACLRSVANFVGSPSKNTTVIPNPSSPVNQRINEVFARLEAWHLVLRSDQRGPSASSSHGYLPKRYLFDTGLLRHLREGAVPSIGVLESSPTLRGALAAVIENQVAIDLMRTSDALTGWKRTSAGNEIDFVGRTPDGSALPIECKATLKCDGRHLRGLHAYLDMLPAPAGCVVSLAPYEVTERHDGRPIVWLPAYAAARLPVLVK